MIRQYRKQWLRWHNGYERMARIIFQRTFKEIAKDIPFDRMTVGTYKSYLQTHVSKEKIFESYVKVYSEVGTKHGKRVGVQINKQINEKNFTIDGFLNEFQRTLTNFLVTNEGSRITTVRQSYIKFLTQIMSKGIADGKTISMISTDMTKLIKSRNFYRWQALRIARTETTAASNYAATVSSSVSGVLMDKVWISALDERTREGKFNHLEMNQKRVPLEEAFNVSGEKLMFPGDPKGSGGNVINCRCSVAQVVRRNADGNIMRIEDVGAPVRNIIPNIGINRIIRNIDLDKNKIDEILATNQNVPKNIVDLIDDFDGFDLSMFDHFKKLQKLNIKKVHANHMGGIVSMNKQTLPSLTNKVYIHESGHFVADSRGWIKRGIFKGEKDKAAKPLDDIFSKWKKDILNKNNRKKYWDEINGISYQSFETLGRKLGYTNSREFIDDIGALKDTFGALTKERIGGGHGVSYYKKVNSQWHEFIAHAYENRFKGNKLFKSMYREMYDDMIKMVDELNLNY
tara:strand:+ start:37 stop:1578 length:1542 start_codon:yes stop_codon:yes gene_type:complete